jgi:hypothetical protein
MLEQITLVGGALVIVGTLVTMLFKMNRLSFMVGEMKQSVADKLDALEKGRSEDRLAAAKVLEDLNRHCMATGIHMDPKAEDWERQVQYDWRKSVDTKLDQLLRKG